MRAFVPVTGSELASLHSRGRLDGPRTGHAATARLHSDWPDADDEECAYAALMAAAYDSLVLLAASGDRHRRVVLVVDLPDAAVRPAGTVEVTAVVIADRIELADVYAVHVDDEGARTDVERAAAAVPAASAGDPAALAAVELEDHELLWYARQEIADLLS